MIISLTGIFFYHMEHSLDNFKVTIHENREAAIKFIYEEAKLYLQECECYCDGDTKCMNCPKKQLVELKDTIRVLNKCGNYNDYDPDVGYCCDDSEFHHKMIITS